MINLKENLNKKKLKNKSNPKVAVWFLPVGGETDFNTSLPLAKDVEDVSLLSTSEKT